MLRWYGQRETASVLLIRDVCSAFGATGQHFDQTAKEISVTHKSQSHHIA
jgi:hypothetical protein